VAELAGRGRAVSAFSRAVFGSGLDLAHPLLVEASAGTGKTYNVQNVYLRLILQAGLTVRQILVVTFTNAATRELRERLRTVLLHCRRELEALAAGQPVTGHPRIHAAIQLARADSDSDADTLRRRIQLALMDFDGAAIFTIHGFCKRVLERYAFECGHDPDAELMPEQSGIVREACQDWWRKHAYGAGSGSVPFQSPGELFDLVSTAYRNPIAKLKGSALPAGIDFGPFISACQTTWRELESLKGKIEWIGGGRLSRAKKNTADATPIAKWAAQADADPAALRPGGAGADAPPLLAALADVLAVARALPAAGDAAPFARHLKTIAESAPAYAVLTQKARVARDLADAVRNRIRDRAALTYEAMLVNVREVLQDPTDGPRLRLLLRAEFRAALIDEFQDTDPVQYDIFRALFASEPNAREERLPLVFVGDPKQAIYGFRGGDVFTYYQAKAHIPPANRHTLGENFRSEAHLVAAINEIFRDDAGGHPTFLNPNVPYAQDLAAHDVDGQTALLVDGIRDAHPLKIWRLPTDPKVDYAGPVAREVVRLLSAPNLTIGGASVRPGQIAVLVMRHREAAQIQQALLAAGVNAVRQSTGSVFDAVDAPRLALAMQAMLEPGRAQVVRSALASGLVPCPWAQLARFKAEEEAPAAPPPATAVNSPGQPGEFEDWIDVFREAGLRWKKFSFVDSFRHVCTRLRIPEHLARQPDGGRRLSDLRHLAELAHQAARAMRLGPVALLGWFTRQLDPARRDAAGDDDDAKPRIADDDDAVQIMTVYKSKGLQFPIVFAPTLWTNKSEAKHGGDPILKYHENDQPVLDLDLESPAGQKAAKAENHEENIRKTYVALTRAINRAYLFEADGQAEPGDYAVAHLLQRFPIPGPGAVVQSGHVLRQFVPADLPSTPWTSPLKPDPESLQARKPTQAVDNQHGQASFSALAPEGAARQVVAAGRDVDGDTAATPKTDEDPADPIFAIPGGAKVGECWHEIFEHVDFPDVAHNPAAVRQIVDHTLDKYRICPEPRDVLPGDVRAAMRARRAAVHGMVAKTLSVPLREDPTAPPFALRDVPRSARRSEMEFQFSLQRTAAETLGGLAAVLDAHWHGPARDDGFIADLESQTREIPQGFMTGFIDLVFRHGERFYLVDWKSNRLNGRPDDFARVGLAAEMRAHAYYLQYLIYVAAIHGFLARHLANYDYDRHFGGVFYLFLRGIDGHSGNGVFADRPAKALVAALADFLGRRP